MEQRGTAQLLTRTSPSYYSQIVWPSTPMARLRIADTSHPVGVFEASNASIAYQM